MADFFSTNGARTYWITNARINAVCFDAGTSEFPSPDQDGLLDADILIDRGRIAAVERAGQSRDGVYFDLAHGQVWPAFADLHTHLDKGHIWPRASNPDGTLPSARAHTAQDRTRNWNDSDVSRRFEFGLRCAWAHGTTAIRSHLDCFEIEQAEISWRVFRKMRERWSGRIAIQAACLTTIDVYASSAGRELVRIVAQSGGILGGVTRFANPDDDSPDAIDQCLDKLFGLAIEHGLDIDLHVDETGDPASNTLAQVARAIDRHRYKGAVVCGHCCSLSVQNEETVSRTISLCRDTGITVVSLPMVNLYLQGRGARMTPRWRGITLLRELKAGGVSVVVASDNCRDPYFAFGDHDMLEVYGQAVRIGHLEHEYGLWPSAITVQPARAMRLPDHGVVRKGAPANLVVFCARSMSELLSRRQSNRVVLNDGVEIDATLPDYRELDA